MLFNVEKAVGIDFQISDVACSSVENKVCVSSYEGRVFGFKWNGSTLVEIFRSRPFKQPVRKLLFSASGKFLICSSGEGGLCLVDSKSGKVKLRIENVFATKSPIGAFISLDVEDRLLAAGNDDGDVIIMDLTNTDSPLVASFDDFDDQVTDMLLISHRKTLICSSGDGTIMVIDLNRNKVIATTNTFDEEINCIAPLKSGSKILCGTGMGSINVFGYNYWGVLENSLSDHPGSVNCMATESFESMTVYTGCSDGLVRALTLHATTSATEVVRLDDSVERMAIFKVKTDDMDACLLFACTCTDGKLHIVDLQATDVSARSATEKKVGKRKIKQVSANRDANEAFFAEMQ